MASNTFDHVAQKGHGQKIFQAMATKFSEKGADWITPVGLFAWAKMKYVGKIKFCIYFFSINFFFFNFF
jgi:hypothetical protein